MTAIEVIEMVAILTDDSQAWFPFENGRDWTFLFDIIKQAQLKTIEKYYSSQDERALRTLYTSEPVSNAGYVPRFLYPRALLIEDVYTADGVTTVNFYTASYQDYDTYINLVRTKSKVYTIKTEVAVGVRYSDIYFNSNDPATFYYLKEPKAFFWDDSGINDSTLSLPLEYHMEVCCLVAEILNNLDKYETERSVALGKDDKIPMENL